MYRTNERKKVSNRSVRWIFAAALVVVVLALVRAAISNARAIKQDMDERFTALQARLEDEANSLADELLGRNARPIAGLRQLSSRGGADTRIRDAPGAASVSSGSRSSFEFLRPSGQILLQEERVSVPEKGLPTAAGLLTGARPHNHSPSIDRDRTLRRIPWPERSVPGAAARGPHQRRK